MTTTKRGNHRGLTSQRSSHGKLIKKRGVPAQTLLKYYPVLDKISKLKSKRGKNQAHALVKKLPHGGINAICECIYNLQWSNKINRKTKQQFRRMPEEIKDKLRKVTEIPKNTKLSTRRNYLTQEGGDITDIIAAVLPFLIPLIFGL